MIREDQISKWQADAYDCCALFERRYASGGIGDTYIRLARRWYDALSRTELDPNELRAVIADAERFEFISDIAFFGFINDMRSTYHRLWEVFLSSNALSRDDSQDR